MNGSIVAQVEVGAPDRTVYSPDPSSDGMSDQVQEVLGVGEPASRAR